MFTGRHLPRSILEPLLLDNARRCEENHRQQLDKTVGGFTDRDKVHATFDAMQKAKKAYLEVKNAD